MISSEKAESAYIQPILLPEKDFSLLPEEAIELTIKKLAYKGVIEIEERERPINPNNWLQEKEELINDFNADFKAYLPEGELYILKDNSQLFLHSTFNYPEYRWEFSISPIHYLSVLNELNKITPFKVEKRSLMNTVLTKISNNGTKYVIDISDSQLKSVIELIKNYPEIQDKIKTFDLCSCNYGISVSYNEVPIYERGTFNTENVYKNGPLELQYEDRIHERDLIGLSSLILASFRYQFSLRNITKYLGSDTMKNRYQALNLGFMRTESQERFVLPESKVSLYIKSRTEKNESTRWVTEIPRQNKQALISFLLSINPSAYIQDGTEDNTDVIIPTPQSKEKTIITVIGKR